MKNYLLLLTILICGQYSFAQCITDTTINAFIKKADSLDLYKNEQWLRLLHYRMADPEEESEIDSDLFFISPNGKTDPQDELRETIRGMLCEKNLREFDTPVDSLNFHPYCKFPARKTFLQKHLGISDSLFPSDNYSCERKNSWLKEHNTTKVTLIFASSYMNNPASVFGHTFLRFDSKKNNKSRAMLNYALNYGATNLHAPGPLYVINGLLGGYKGVYSFFPYYNAIQSYANMEQRDMWEYGLNLDSAQINTLVDHVWELGDTWMDYYFFDENCSYNILTILDVVNPGWKLSDDYEYFAVPVETLKSIERIPGLVDKIYFRPSLFTKMTYNYEHLTEAGQSVVNNIKDADTIDLHTEIQKTQLDSGKFLQAVDVGLDYVQMKKRKSKEIEDLRYWGKKQRSLLLQRVKFNKTKAEKILDVPIDSLNMPHMSHTPSRFGVYGGLMHFMPYLSIQTRLAYHDDNAEETGLLPGSGVENIAADFRIYYDKDENVRFRLHSIYGFRIQALLPHNSFIDPYSWRYNISIDSKLHNGEFRNSFFTEAGVGKTVTFLNSSLWFYSMVELRVRVAPWYDYYSNVGPQGRFGIRLRPARDISFVAWGTYYYPLLGDDTKEYTVFAEVRVSATKTSELRLRTEVNEGFGEFGLHYHYYY